MMVPRGLRMPEPAPRSIPKPRSFQVRSSAQAKWDCGSLGDVPAVRPQRPASQLASLVTGAQRGSWDYDGGTSSRQGGNRGPSTGLSGLAFFRTDDEDSSSLSWGEGDLTTGVSPRTQSTGATRQKRMHLGFGKVGGKYTVSGLMLRG